MPIGNKDKFTGKIFIKLWLPALISSFGLAFADMADAIVVGRKIGADGLAAISICLPIYMVINVFMHSIGLGGSARFSKLLGEGKKREAEEVFSKTITAAALLGILLAASGNIFIIPVMKLLGAGEVGTGVFNNSLCYGRIIISAIPLFFIAYILNYYLRNDNNQKLAATGFTTANICDIVMNILFVLVFDMGAGGAALSTAIGQLIAIVIYAVGLLRKNHNLRLRLCKAYIKTTLTCFKSGFSVSVQYIFQFAFLIIANNILMRMSGTAGVAVFDVVQNVSYLIMYLYGSAAQAMQPLVSTYCGERNVQGRRRTFGLGCVCGSMAGGAAILFVILFPQLMCALFGLDAEITASVGIMALRIYAIGAIFGGLGTVTESYCQSCGMDKSAFMLAALRGAVILIPCMAVFSFVSINWFWLLFPCTEILSLAAFLIYKRFVNDTLPNSTERIYSKTIENKSEDLTALAAETEEFCISEGANASQVYFVTMAVEEICLAIMKNAFTDSGGYIQLTVIAKENKEFELHIRDSAVKFNPFSLDTQKANTEGEYNIDAMGMLVIKNKAKSFFYRQYQGYNTLVLTI